MRFSTRRQVLAGFAVAAGAAAVKTARAQERLRVGVLRLASSGPVFIAFERGYFRDQGFDVELKFFDAAQPIAVATASGDVEFGVTAFTGGLFNLAGKGALRIVARQAVQIANPNGHPCVNRRFATARRMPMQVPVEIAFHNIESSAWAEQEIRKRIKKLEKIYDRLISCRVRVDQRNKTGGGTIPPVVRIEMGIPGRKELVVAHEPDRLQRKFQTPDLRNAIHEAFRIAEDQLAELKRERNDRAREPQHETENQFLGQVAEMHAEEDFGFLLTKEGGLLYFHRNCMLSGDFEKLRQGHEVYYVEAVGDTGPIATKVRVKEKD